MLANSQSFSANRIEYYTILLSVSLSFFLSLFFAIGSVFLYSYLCVILCFCSTVYLFILYTYIIFFFSTFYLIPQTRIHFYFFLLCFVIFFLHYGTLIFYLFFSSFLANFSPFSTQVLKINEAHSIWYRAELRSLSTWLNGIKLLCYHYKM